MNSKKTYFLRISVMIWCFTSTTVCAEKFLHILFVVDVYPWYTKEVITNQAIGLLEKGHEVYIHSVERPEKEIKIPSVQKYLNKRISYETLPTDLDTYDVIVFQYGVLAKKFIHLKRDSSIKAKFVTFFRGTDITADKKICGDEYKDVFELGDLFLPVCQYFKFRLILLGCDEQKIKVVPSGINCNRFLYKERILKKDEKVCLVSVGRFVPKKAFADSIVAFAQVIKQYPHTKYIIVGDGPLRAHLEELIKRLNIGRYVHLVGWKSQKELVKILESAHIYVFTPVTSQGGTQEGISNVLKEAMLSGLPIITTYHGGNIELVQQGTSGYLVPERDINKLVNRIIYLIKRPQVWPAMGKAGSDFVRKHFEMRVINDQLEQILCDICGV